MARITVEDCIDKFESRFELVLVASNRARKLHSGVSPTIEKDNDKNTVIALREIANETIAIDEMKNSLIEEYQTVSLQIDEDLSLEYTDSENAETDKDTNLSNEDDKSVFSQEEDDNVVTINEQDNSQSQDTEINSEDEDSDYHQVDTKQNLEEESV